MKTLTKKQQASPRLDGKGRRRWTKDDSELTLLAIPTFVWYVLFCYLPMFGIVLASTVVIIPLHYDGARDALLCLLAAALGALAAYLSAKLQPKEDA